MLGNSICLLNTSVFGGFRSRSVPSFRTPEGNANLRDGKTRTGEQAVIQHKDNLLDPTMIGRYMGIDLCELEFAKLLAVDGNDNGEGRTTNNEERILQRNANAMRRMFPYSELSFQTSDDYKRRSNQGLVSNQLF